MCMFINKKKKFNQPFLSFQANNIFIGKSKVCEKTEFSGAEKKKNLMAILFDFNVKIMKMFILLD